MTHFFSSSLGSRDLFFLHMFLLRLVPSACRELCDRDTMFFTLSIMANMATMALSVVAIHGTFSRKVSFHAFF